MIGDTILYALMFLMFGVGGLISLRLYREGGGSWAHAANYILIAVGLAILLYERWKDGR